MTTPFSDSLNFENLKKQAKGLLQDVLSGDATAVQRMHRFHPEFGVGSRTTQPLDNARLADAQLVVARENGFPSWPRLKKEVDRLAAIAVQEATEDASRSPSDRLAERFDAFYATLKDTKKADRTKLRQAMEIVKRLLVEGYPLDAETVVQARKVCYWSADMGTTVLLNEQYLKTQLSIEEYVKAQTEIIFALSELKRDDEVIARAEQLYQWAKTTLPQDRLPWILGHTQDRSWIARDRGEEWVRLAEDTIKTAPRLESNRMERFYLLRQIGFAYGFMGGWRESLSALERVKEIADEDESWPYRHSLYVRSIANLCRAYRGLDDTAGEQHALNKAKMHLDQYALSTEGNPNAVLRELKILRNNLGHAYFHAKQYEKAITLFREYIEPIENDRDAWAATVLGAAIWASRQDRVGTLALLRHAAAVSHSGSRVDISGFPEFSDVRGDPEFIAASVMA